MGGRTSGLRRSSEARPAGGTDGGTPDCRLGWRHFADGGTSPDGGTDGGVAGHALLLDVIDSGKNPILAVDQAGTVYLDSVGDSGRPALASPAGASTGALRGTGRKRPRGDGPGGRHDASAGWTVLGHFLSRSTDRGATLKRRGAIGTTWITPHSFAALRVVYFLEYQVFARPTRRSHCEALGDMDHFPTGPTWSVSTSIRDPARARACADPRPARALGL